MRIVFASIVLLGATFASAAGAQETVRLDVESNAETRTCGDGEVLRVRVAERLGRDPFARDGDKRLRVAYARDKGAWKADIELFDASGKKIGARPLSRSGATCEPLTSSVVFTIVVLLEDLAPRPAPPAPPPPPPEPPPPVEPDLPPAAPLPPPRTTYFDVALGGAGAVGGAPAPIAGGEALAGLDVSRFRLELSVRLFLPASGDDAVTVRTRLVYGRIAPCYGWVVLSACFVAAVGGLSGEGRGDRVASARVDGGVYAAAGAGIVSRVFLVKDVLFVRAAADLLFSLSRVGFDVGDERVWTLPAVGTAGTIGVGARLP